jgi:fibro-slime domain-containing protein
VRDFRGTHPDFNVPASDFGYTAGSVDPDLGPDGKPKAQNKVESNGSNGASSANVTISKWGMDENGGTGINDNKGNHDGTMMNGGVRIKGQFGGGIEFDGIDDFIEVPHNPAFLLAGGSIAFWFKTPSPGARQGLVTKDSTGFDSGGHLSIYLDSGRVEWRHQSTGASYYTRSAPGSVLPDTWHHVTASFGSLGMKLYFDGVLVDTDAYTGGLDVTSGGAGNFEPWAFGVMTWQSANQSVAGWNQPLTGAIDEVQLIDGQIDDTEFNLTGGYLVANVFRNAAGDPIAPHLYGSSWCVNGATPAPCIDPSTDIAGTVGTTGSGGMTSTASFDEWFNDVLGSNMSARVDITLVLDAATGVYEYENDLFFPIDGAVFGNEGELHNFNFTYTFCGTFTYEECTGQFFEFVGGDGSWLFVDDRLALDQSGAGTLGGQKIELDRMCLVDGETYSIDFFFAQRQTLYSIFRLRTNVVIDSCNKPTPVFAPYD